MAYLSTAWLELLVSLALLLTFSLTLLLVFIFSITAVESLVVDTLGLMGHTAFGSGARFAIRVDGFSSPVLKVWTFPKLLIVELSLRPSGGKSAAKSKSVATDADSDMDSPKNIGNIIYYSDTNQGYILLENSFRQFIKKSVWFTLPVTESDVIDDVPVDFWWLWW